MGDRDSDGLQTWKAKPLFSTRAGRFLHCGKTRPQASCFGCREAALRTADRRPGLLKAMSAGRPASHIANRRGLIVMRTASGGNTCHEPSS
jgi:hypothetical protein